jgi:hypothetical protein
MSLFSLAGWRPRHLFLSWLAYWLLLLLVALGPAIPAIWRATRDGAHGEVSAGVNDGILSLTVKLAGTTTWSGSISLLSAALWFAIPPLVLWVLWVVTRPRPERVTELRG